MKNAAMILGVIAGLVGMVVGFAAYGFTVFVDWVDEPQLIEQAENVETIRILGVVAPILAIAGGAMSLGRPLIGAVLLLLSAGGMYYAFDFGLFTVFPIAMAGLGGVLALGGSTSKNPIE